jgi:hypothetical protein
LFGKIWRAVKRGAKAIARGARELAHRFVGVFDWIGSWLGIRPKQYLRLKVKVLKNVKGTHVAKEKRIQEMVDNTVRIFSERMNIAIQSPNPRTGGIVEMMHEETQPWGVSPTVSIQGAFGLVGDYFNSLCTYVHSSSGSFILDWLGIGEPVYVFIVHKINGSTDLDGWAAPVVHNFCLVEADGDDLTMAHEICHLCGVWIHSGGGNDLMHAQGRGEHLSAAQIATVRSSRYVTFRP